MNDIISSVRELVEINRKLAQQQKQIVEKLNAIDKHLHDERQEQRAREEFKSQRFREMDIAYVMKHKDISPQKAAAKLEENGHNIEKILRGWGGTAEHYLEHMSSFYERKKNQAIIEMW